MPERRAVAWQSCACLARIKILGFDPSKENAKWVVCGSQDVVCELLNGRGQSVTRRRGTGRRAFQPAILQNEIQE